MKNSKLIETKIVLEWLSKELDRLDDKLYKSEEYTKTLTLYKKVEKKLEDLMWDWISNNT